ncbi:TlpA family protein disulfide reductase [Sphingobacterium chuzhouense]|uniref:TlpA family protein disulfide reductase n=1 Tax=Sphingobacterium chuzhouense TaxID=1742264 RepID=A0ABR7XPV8_9SPHI|nr:TlpA disulfide reductase family protein [Sphingobacterium chuzhouense]MBD1421211.1 TlpA family protein disulfide reductase [Sphingobacterium chuzhouense]
MKKIVLLIYTIFNLTLLFSQEKTIIELQKIDGYGPHGKTSFGISEKRDSERRELYPSAKNIPENWNDVREYYYELNPKQLIYQSAHLLDTMSSSLAKLLETEDIDLKDSVNYAEEPLACGINIVIGRDSLGMHYIIDRNQNNDFGDDVVRPVVGRNTSSSVPNNPDYVFYQYWYDGKVHNDTLIISVSEINNNVFFSFPQFYLSTFKYKNNTYYFCKNIGNRGAFVVPAIPYFSALPPEKRVLKGQYFNLGEDTFKLSRILYDGKFIEIEGTAMLTDTIKTVKENCNIHQASDQAGFLAPAISGRDVLNGDMWTLDSVDKDKLIFIYFWSTTCGPCLQDLPNLTRIANKYKDKVEFVGICDVRTDLDAVLNKHNINWTMIKLQDAETEVNKYNIYKYPSSYLLNSERFIQRVDMRSAQLEEFILENIL